MQYVSTRGGGQVSPSEAIIQGICPLGGLYVPEAFPQLDLTKLQAYASYPKLAAAVMHPYLDISYEELLPMAQEAYGNQFDTESIAPLKNITAQESILELWHGPTLAFKDMALQMLPRLMAHAMRVTGEKKKIYILVATSGDTGKAALCGFQDVPDTTLQVFYPHGGVSHAQWLQMVTQEGGNVHVCGVEGNFDDAQTAVKNIFGDPAVNREINAKGYRISSANSINWGRLLPQIAYYFYAYLDLCRTGAIYIGDKINFCVPTGNFGNILAGYYAMRMGLPIHRLLCASNRNNVLTDFFHSGEYDSNRLFYQSMSCSIDILVSSNLERLLFEMANRDCEQVRHWMQALKTGGKYEVGAAVSQNLQSIFTADWCDEDATLSTIRTFFDTHGYLMDPHTAVAQAMYSRYTAEEKDAPHTVLLSTAHPYKFAKDVLYAFEAPQSGDEEGAIKRLNLLTGCAVPQSIAALGKKPILHNTVRGIHEMKNRVLEVI